MLSYVLVGPTPISTGGTTKAAFLLRSFPLFPKWNNQVNYFTCADQFTSFWFSILMIGISWWGRGGVQKGQYLTALHFAPPPVEPWNVQTATNVQTTTFVQKFRHLWTQGALKVQICKNTSTTNGQTWRPQNNVQRFNFDVKCANHCFHQESVYPTLSTILFV